MSIVAKVTLCCLPVMVDTQPFKEIANAITHMWRKLCYAVLAMARDGAENGFFANRLCPDASFELYGGG